MITSDKIAKKAGISRERLRQIATDGATSETVERVASAIEQEAKKMADQIRAKSTGVRRTAAPKIALIEGEEVRFTACSAYRYPSAIGKREKKRGLVFIGRGALISAPPYLLKRFGTKQIYFWK